MSIWTPPPDLQLLGPFSCVWTREEEGLPPRADGGCVHCGWPANAEIHSEMRRKEVAARYAKEQAT